MHEEFGTLGFAPSWIPESDPFTGFTVSHDILEHMPNEKYGAVEGEFMALGAMYWIRGESGWFHQINVYRSNLLIETMSLDIPDIITRVVYGHQTFKILRNTKKLDDYIEEDFKAIIVNGIRSLHVEDRLTPQELSSVKIKDIKISMLSWMRKGYRQALKRYKGHCKYDMTHLFTEVMEKSDKILKQAYEYQTLVVKIDLNKMSSRVYIEGEEYDY